MLFLTNQSQLSWLFSIQQPQKAFENTSVDCHATFYLEKATFLLVFDIARVARVFDLPYRPGRKLGRLGQIRCNLQKHYLSLAKFCYNERHQLGRDRP